MIGERGVSVEIRCFDGGLKDEVEGDRGCVWESFVRSEYDREAFEVTSEDVDRALSGECEK